MDPVTHGLAGYALSNLFKRERATVIVLIAASLAPDLDYVTRIWGLDVFLRYHRGITHGILFLFIAPLLIGLAARWLTGKGFLFYSFISFLGYGVHLAMDLTNQYPTRIFSPLDWSKYSLNLTFIIDPYIIGALLIILFMTLKKGANRRTITIVFLLLMILYATSKYLLRGITEDFLRERLDEYHYTLIPLPNDFTRWWFVTSSGKHYKVGVVDLLTETVCIKKEYLYSEKDPEVRESKGLRVVKNFLYFARFPMPEITHTEEGSVVTWRELSYSFIPGEHFIATVRFDKKGRAVDEYFRF